MSDIQKFRKAVNGFNRQDVVGYIEYLNNKHRSEINQLQNQLQVATRPIEDNGLKAENETLKQEIALLKAQLADAQAKPAAEPTVTPVGPSCTEQELEAYRRAERAERLAIERARATSRLAKGVLADATAQIRISATQLEESAKNMAAQMEVYREAVLSAGNILNDAAASLGTVCPEE